VADSTAPLELPIGVTESKVLQQIARIESQLRKVQQGAQRDFVRANQHIAQSFQGMSKSTVGSLQNVSFQLQDIFVQIQSGTSISRALSQQMPQLLGGFGAAGAAAGLAAAALIPLIANLVSTGDEAENADKAMDELEKSFSAYSRYVKVATTDTAALVEEYGRLAGRVREGSRLLAEAAVARIRDKAKEALDPVKGQLDAIGELAARIEAIAPLEAKMREAATRDPGLAKSLAQFDDLRLQLEAASQALGLTGDQAVDLVKKIDAAFNATSVQEMADRAYDAVEAFNQLGLSGLELPAPLREALGYLEEMGRSSARAAKESEILNDWLNSAKLALMDMIANAPASGWLAGAISDASTLAGTLWEAARAAASAWGKINAPDGFDAAGNPVIPGLGDKKPSAAPSGIGGIDWGTSPKASGGGGGGQSEAEKEYNRLLRERDSLLRDIQTPLESYAEQLALIDQLATTRDQKTGDFLITAAEADEARKRLESLQPAAQELRSALRSAFDGVFDDPKQALEDLGKQLLQMALNMQLMKWFPGVFGGNGLIPLTPNAAGGVYSGPGIGAYSGKVVDRPTIFPFAKGAGLMGEAGPEAILPLTRVNGKLGVQASGGGVGTSIKIIDQRGGDDPPIETERRRGPSGEEMVIMTVKKNWARGAFDPSMQARQGVLPRKVVR
jgi:hypothetical protein